MCTTRSLTISPYLVIYHARPQEQPHTPPGSNHTCPPEQPCMPPWSNHAHPQEQPCTPQSNHTCPSWSNHTCTSWEQPCTPQKQPHMPPRSNHICSPEQPCTPPRATMYMPPRATMHTPLWTECGHMLLKILPCPNFVAGSNKELFVDLVTIIHAHSYTILQ